MNEFCSKELLGCDCISPIGVLDEEAKQHGGGLWVGDLDASSWKLVEERSIDVVLSLVQAHLPLPPYFSSPQRDHLPLQPFPRMHWVVWVDDHRRCRPTMMRVCRDVAPLLARWIRDGSRVLVHCQMGISRSCTAAAAILMWLERLSVVEALRRVVAARPITEPNRDFLALLFELESRVFSSSQ